MKYYIILGFAIGFVLGFIAGAATFELINTSCITEPPLFIPVVAAAFPRRERAYHWLADMLDNFDYDQFEIPPADRCNVHYFEIAA